MPLTVTYPLDEDTFNRGINNFTTTSTAILNAGALSLPLTAGQAALPATGIVSIESEIVYYEAKVPGVGDATTLTITAGGRGFGGTADVTHTSGSVVERRPVAEDINQMQSTIEALTLQAGLYKSGIALATAPAVAAQVDPLFTLDNGTVDTNRRGMIIDFHIKRLIPAGNIYALGRLTCVRHTGDGDNPQIGDLDETVSAWDVAGIPTAVGVTFSMSTTGASSTTVNYVTGTIVGTTAIAFSGRVYYFP